MYRFLWCLVWPFFKLFYPHKVIGKQNMLYNQPTIIVSNHYSNMDILVVGLSIRRKMHFVGKKELFKGKFVTWFMKKMGVIKLDRENVDLESIKNCLKVLKNNELLTIFPEGTRNKVDEQLKNIKNGVCMLAIRGKAKIIPVNILNSAKVFKRNRVVIGEPFELSNFYGQKLTGEVLSEAGEIVFDKMKDLEVYNKNYIKLKNQAKQTKKNPQKHKCADIEKESLAEQDEQ